MITDLIQIDIDEEIPDKPGYVRTIDTATIEDVYNQIVELMTNSMYEEMDYFKVCYDKRNEKIPMDYRRIFAYVVLGDNEGHYIHVDIMTNVKSETYIIGKSFMGFEKAQETASYISSLFNSWETRNIRV